MTAQRLPAPQLPAWLSDMVPFSRYCIRSGDQTIHVMESGQGRPVLCLHGNPTWGFLYRRIALRLWREPVRLIMPDLVGLGFSSRVADEQHQLDLHAGWIGDIIDELELDDIVFVGQDWGGPIGLLALADRVDRLSGMVILNTVVSPPKENFRPSFFHRFSRAPIASDVAFRLLGFPQINLGMAQGDPTSVRGQVARAYRHPLRSLRTNNAPLALARMVPPAHDHPSVVGLKRVHELFTTFDGPVNVVWGDRDPVLGSVRRWIEKIRPDANIVRTQAGHFLQEEVPGTIAEAILALD